MKNILLASLISIAAASAAIAPTEAAVVRTGDHAHERHCRIKTVTRWFHHHRVVQKIRVCHPKH